MLQKINYSIGLISLISSLSFADDSSNNPLREVVISVMVESYRIGCVEAFPNDPNQREVVYNSCTKKAEKFRERITTPKRQAENDDILDDSGEEDEPVYV